MIKVINYDSKDKEPLPDSFSIYLSGIDFDNWKTDFISYIFQVFPSINITFLIGENTDKLEWNHLCTELCDTIILNLNKIDIKSCIEFGKNFDSGKILICCDNKLKYFNLITEYCKINKVKIFFNMENLTKYIITAFSGVLHTLEGGHNIVENNSDND